MKKSLVLLFILLATIATTIAAPKPTKIIFDTDMGNDVDDIIALDMLYKYREEGRVDLLGIVSSKRELGSVKFIDAMATLYGHADIPLGIVKTLPGENYKCTDKVLNFADWAVQQHNYPHTIKDYSQLEDGYKLYRRLLAEAKDGEVVVVVVGFSTNLMRLLDSTPDEYSPLNGKELMSRKIARIVLMAGHFSAPHREFNVYFDRVASTRLFAESPCEMLVSDFSIGKSILFPYTAVDDSFDYAQPHLAREAYYYYAQMPYNRPTWDPTAVLFAVEPNGGYASLSPKGFITVDQKCLTTFTKDRNSKHRYFVVNDRQRVKIRQRITELTLRTPQKFAK